MKPETRLIVATCVAILVLFTFLAICGEADASDVVPMRISSDCEEAALSTAAGVSYDRAKAAVGKTPFLPESATDPIYGNPIAMKAAIEKLGFKPILRTQTDILNGVGNFRKTVVLLIADTASQHWVCGDRVEGGRVWFHWGDGSVKGFTIEKFKTLFGPTQTHLFRFNAAYEVGEKQRRTSAIQRLLNFFKKLFR